MSYVQAFQCDQCGKQKEVSNHWWIAYIDGGFELCAWKHDLAMKKFSKHLCGEGCAAKLMSQWMETTSKTTA